MSGDQAVELAVIRGADRALRRAAERAKARAADARASDNLGKAAIEDRNAAAWSACADDVAALKGPRFSMEGA